MDVSQSDRRMPSAHEVSQKTVYTKNQGLNRNILAAIQQEIKLEPAYVKAWYARKQREHMKSEHAYIEERHKTLGPDLATAHFVVARGGSVKFVDNENWIDEDNMKSEEASTPRLPGVFIKEAHLEAVDATSTTMMYESFDNFVRLRYLKYLNLSACERIDDFCLDRLTHQFSRSLVYLDISGCPRITHAGISTLHRLRKLKRLVMRDMSSVDHVPLVVSMLSQCMPECAVDYDESDTTIKPNLFIESLKRYSQVSDEMEKVEH